jgi:catechol-2,3-dioxygenase
MIGTLKTVVLDASDIKALSAFYAEVGGWKQTYADDDWINLDGPPQWRLGFQRAPDHQAPRWPDPAHPQQFHLDLRVTDMEAAAQHAEKLGATRLGGGATWQTLADPAGHPFDLCQADQQEVFAVTIDTADPAGLAQFYADLLGLDRQYDGDEGSLIGAEGKATIMFQRVADHQPPRWPDPAYPQQFHLDIEVADVDEAEPKVLALGATRLNGGGENWRVYADPTGHPFCLTW